MRKTLLQFLKIVRIATCKWRLFTKEKIVDFFKGICIGIANVIPGFSGGTMAVILNIYEKVIYAFSNIFSHPIEVLKKLWTLLIGVIVGIIVFVLAIAKLLELFPLPTIIFFIGLIVGSIPNVYSNARKNTKVTIKDIIAFVVAIAIMVVLPLINSNSFSGNINIVVIIMLFLMGIISAAAMVIPGISGSLVLMAFGYYIYIVTNIKELLAGFLTFDFTNLFTSFVSVLVFVIGCILGAVYVAKLINLLLKQHHQTVYFTILGLLIASPFVIVWMNYESLLSNTKIESIIIGVICFILGIVSVIFLGRLSKKTDE